MEAGAAAGAQAPGAVADAPAPGEPQGEAAAPQAPEAPDYAAMQAQLAELGPGLDEIRSLLAANQAPKPGAEPEEPAGPPDLSYLDPSSAEYNPQQAGERMLQVIAQQSEQAIQAAVGPIAQELSRTQQQLAAQELVTEFPDLGDEKVAQQVLQASNQWVAAAGLPPEAAQSPQVWRAVYLMSVAAELQAKEKDAPVTTPATLEGAGGASPAGGSPSRAGTTADDIIGARGRSVLPFG